MATAAAAVMAGARRRILSRLSGQNAVSPGSAVPLEPGNIVQRRMFGRMLEAGVIREAEAGRYWIDAAALDAWKRRARKRVAIAMSAVAVISAAAALFA